MMDPSLERCLDFSKAAFATAQRAICTLQEIDNPRAIELLTEEWTIEQQRLIVAWNTNIERR